MKMPEKCAEPCADLIRLEKELDKFQGQNSDTHREIFKRLNELEKAEAAQEKHFETVNEKLDKLIEWQENQRDKPGKRWESIVEKAIWAVCAAVIAFLLAQVGL